MSRLSFFKYTVIFFCFLSGLQSFGQLSNDEQIAILKNVIPPSPNSASLGKYGDWPVSLYTGVPSISIPVCELKGRSLSVPVSLSYHASGNRVGEIASWVGLGWSLNAGGAITRSIRGLPDDYGGYFENASHFSNPDDFSSTVPSTFLSQLTVASVKNNSDTQEDIYTLNALGKSYKFILHADGTIQTIPLSGIKLPTNPLAGPNMTANTWTVVLEDGTKLLFGGTNFTETTGDPNYPVGDGRGISYTSSWMLQSITSASGEVINFSYTSAGIDQDSYYSQSDYIEYKNSVHGGPGSNCANVNESSTTKTSIQRQHTAILNLSSIESELGRVDFIIDSSERQDLEGGNALREIKLFSKLSNTYIEDYILTTGYSQAVSGSELSDGISDGTYKNYRLRLNSLEKKDMSNLSVTGQKWTFDYNPQNLPSRRSFAQDHWGFFNGSTSNTTLLPKEYFALPSASVAAASGYDLTKYGFMPSLHKLGANREGNATYMQAEILTAIHYPTGGTTEFTYEANTVPVTEETFTTTALPQLALNMSATQNPPSNESSITFTATKPQYIHISASSSRSHMDNSNLRTHASVLNQAGNSVVDLSGTSDQWADDQWFNLLNAGTYTFKVWTNLNPSELEGTDDHLSILANLTYDQSNGTQTYDKIAGGLRISNIKEYDGTSTNPVNQRSFIYESPLVINPVDLVNDYTTQQDKYIKGQGNEQCDYVTITRNSSSKFSPGNIQGGTVAYGKVTTLYGPNGENGVTVSVFSNENDMSLLESKTFPYPAPDSRDHRRGLLIEETQLKPDRVTALKKTTNDYTFVTSGYVRGFKAGRSINLDPSLCLDIYGNCGITTRNCTTTSEQVKHTSTTQLTYDMNGQNPVTVTTNYFYDNPGNLQPVRMETTDSKGNTLKTYNRTVLEKTDINAITPLTPAASAAIDAMISRNMISAVIQQEKQRAGTLTNLSLTNYKILDAVNIVPENVQVKVSSNPLDTRVLFNQYNSNGNLTEQQKTNDVKEVYLWGYKSTYPVAKVIGSDLATVSGFINQAILDNATGEYTDEQMRTELAKIRTGLAGTKALVTTYTYAPLIGMTSQTDPNGRTMYYEYDGMNRLKLIRDQDNYILKTYDYKYQQDDNN